MLENLSTIKISIITAVYNRESTVERAIQSVLQQNYSNIEYIIIDGGSTDNTLEKIRPYRNHLAYFCSEPDGGIYHALNKGLAAATGDIIGFLHSDDYLAHPHVIQNIACAFEKNTSAELVYADINFFDSITKRITRHYSSRFFSPWMFRMALQPAHPSVYAKAEVYKSVGDFDTNFSISADFDWLLRAIRIKKITFTYIPETWVMMQHGGTSTRDLKALLKHNHQDLQSLKKHGIYSNWIFVLLKYPFKLFQLR